MFKRLIIALVEGCVVAAIVVGALRALGADWSSGSVAYGAALVAGVLIGLVAGRPVWKQSVKVEALLKSVAGAFIAVTTLFGIRKWMPHSTVDLGALGRGPLGSVPAAALPLVASALSMVFEVDDLFGPTAKTSTAIGEPPPSGDGVDRSSARTKRLPPDV